MLGALSFVVAASTMLVVFLRTLWSFAMRRRDLHELPGPKARFILGNVLDLPGSSEPEEDFARMAERYGPIFQLKLPKANLIVVTDAKIADELFEKRGSIYSDRPSFTMADLSGWEWNLVTMRHGAAWRMRKKIIHQYVYNKQHPETQHRAALVLAQKLLNTPAEFIEHIRHAAADSILFATYGIQIAPGDDSDDPYVALAERAAIVLSRVTTPGAWIVDTISILRYIPTWFPGAGFKRYALSQRAIVQDLLNVPFDRTRADMAAAIAPSSMVADALVMNPVGEHLKAIKEAAATMYLGGADTTASILISFISAMARNSDVLRDAYTEILRVVGPDRLPVFSDRESLPYVEAVILEVYRMYPVGSLNIHAVEKDDIYEGMYIQKGSIVAINSWAILRDPNVYDDPNCFRPSRFLRRDGKINNTVPDPRPHFFGQGRRICPGRLFADSSVFITVATILACFDIKPTVENGIDIIPDGRFYPGIIRTPIPFKCTITPKHETVRQLVQRNLADL